MPLPAQVVLSRSLKASMAAASKASLALLQKKLDAVKYRVANQFWAQSLDHALHMGLGVDLSYFHRKNPCVAVRIPCKRYFLSPESSIASSLPGASVDGLCRRSCIEDTSTGVRWWEVPRFVTAESASRMRPSLHLCIDRGSVGWPAAMFLYTRCAVRGCLFSDYAHDDWNALKGAATVSGTWLALLERVVVLNLPSGPWEGSSFFRAIQKSAESYFNACDSTDDLFSVMFNRICRERGDDPDDFGTRAHRERVWKSIQSSPAFARKGMRVRLGRWYALFTAADEKQGEMSILLLVLLHMGMRGGYWKKSTANPASMLLDGTGVDVPPDASVPLAVAPPAGLGSVGSSGAVPDFAKTSVASSNKQLKTQRESAQNTMDLAAQILSNEKQCRVVDGIRHVIHWFHHSFGLAITKATTKKGTLELFTEFAQGHVNTQFMHSALLSLSCGGESFRRIGFADRSSSLGPAALAGDTEVAGKMMRFVVAFVGLRLANHLQYMASLPGALVLLVHPLASVRRSCLAALKSLWERLLVAEELALGSSFIEAFLKNLCWPQFCWIREVLVLLAEWSFEQVPIEVEVGVRSLFTGLLSTNIVELANNLLRKKETSNRRHALARLQRYHQLITSPLLKEHDRHAPPQTEASKRSRAKHLPRAVFDCDVTDFSLGMDTLAHMSADTSFSSPNAASWRAISFAMEAWRALDGDWARLRTCWLSLLLAPGTGLVKTSDYKHVLMTMHVTRWGIIA